MAGTVIPTAIVMTMSMTTDDFRIKEETFRFVYSNSNTRLRNADDSSVLVSTRSYGNADRRESGTSPCFFFAGYHQMGGTSSGGFVENFEGCHVIKTKEICHRGEPPKHKVVYGWCCGQFCTKVQTFV